MTSAIPRSRQRTRPGKPSRRGRRADPAPDGALGILEQQAAFFLRHAEALQRRLEQVAADPTRGDEVSQIAAQIIEARKHAAQFAASALAARANEPPEPERLTLKSNASAAEAIAVYLRVVNGGTVELVSACCSSAIETVAVCKACGSACDHKPAAPKPVEPAAQTPAAPCYQETTDGNTKQSAASVEVEIEPEIARSQEAPPREVPPPPKRRNGDALVAKLSAPRRQLVFFR